MTYPFKEQIMQYLSKRIERAKEKILTELNSLPELMDVVKSEVSAKPINVCDTQNALTELGNSFLAMQNWLQIIDDAREVMLTMEKIEKGEGKSIVSFPGIIGEDKEGRSNNNTGGSH